MACFNCKIIVKSKTFISNELLNENQNYRGGTDVINVGEILSK